MKKLLLLFVSVSTALLSSAQIANNISIKGYTSFEFEYQTTDVGGGDRNASFDADLFDIVLNIQATPKLRVAADLTWEHGTATEENWGNAAVEYAFSEYTVNELLKIKAGKMFTAFGIYNEIHTAKPAFLTTKEPLSTNKNHKLGSDLRFYPRWGTGIALLGKTNLGKLNASYVLQITNGSQENTNPFEEDDNMEKAIAGRIEISKRTDFKFGISGYTDQLTEFDTSGTDNGQRTFLQSYGAYFIGNLKNLGVELEYVFGTINPTNSDVLMRQGFTTMLSYNHKRYTPYVRFEYLNPNMSKTLCTASIISPGINIKIADGYFLKMQYNFIQSATLNADLNGVNYQEIQTALVVGF